MNNDIHHIVLEKRVIKFIKNLPAKHQVQIKKYILNLQENPIPHDSKMVKNHGPYRRGDSGEYRIVYRLDDVTRTVYVILVGKRNGGEVYKTLKSVLN